MRTASITRRGIAGGLAMAAILAFGANSAEARKYEEEKKISETFAVEGAEAIRINFNVGELEIKQGEADVIRVEGRLTAKSKRRAAAQDAIEDVGIEFESGSTVRLSLDEPRSRTKVTYSVDLVITLPAGPNLNVKLNVGELRARIHPPEKSRFVVNVGELDLRLPRDIAAEIRADVNVGDFSLRGFDERSTSSHRSRFVGERFEGRIGDSGPASERRIDLEVNVGEISVRGSSEVASRD